MPFCGMDFDYIIIGGGIAGLSLGAKLAGAGSLLLIERETNLGYHASGRSAALYEPITVHQKSSRFPVNQVMRSMRWQVF